MAEAFFRIIDAVLDILFPDLLGDGLLRFAESRPQPMEALPENAWAEGIVLSALPYRALAVRRSLWQFKYKGSQKVAAILAGALSGTIARAAGTEEIRARLDGKKILVIPIPSSARRLKERGFDQTAMLARFVVRKDKAGILESGTDVLYKIKDTKRQAHIKDRKIRLGNIKDSMRADPEKAFGRLVILIDDVSTTGATLKEGRRALLAAGAAGVLCISACH